MTTRSTDYYGVLGLSRAADASQIKHAYRFLARACHPDLNPNDAEGEERFKRITEAYEVLRNPVLRTAYDRDGSVPPSSHLQAHASAGSIYDDDFLRLLRVFRRYKLRDQMPL